MGNMALGNTAKNNLKMAFCAVAGGATFHAISAKLFDNAGFMPSDPQELTLMAGILISSSFLAFTIVDKVFNKGKTPLFGLISTAMGLCANAYFTMNSNMMEANYADLAKEFPVASASLQHGCTTNKFTVKDKQGNIYQCPTGTADSVLAYKVDANTPSLRGRITPTI